MIQNASSASCLTRTHLYASHNNPLKDRPRILIVDDEPVVLTALQLAFEDMDWHIEVVTAAAPALERSRKNPFDLIITDKNLPDMDGVALLRILRQENDRVRFIMITGYGSVESAIATTNLGIDAYLEKPFSDIFDVTRTVAQVLEKKRSTVGNRIAQFFSRKTGSVAAITDDTPPPAPASASAARPRASRDRPPVLIASAELRSRKQIASHISGAGGRPVLASTSREIFEFLASEPPAAVIVCGALDVVELVEQVRKRAPESVVAVVSDSLDLVSVKLLIGLGIGAIINVTVDAEDFGKRIDKLLKGIRAARRS